MAISLPLSLNDFADRLKISEVKWKVQRYDELSGLGTGDVLAAEMAPPRITGTVTLAPMRHAEAAAVQALIEVLEPAQSFYLYDPRGMFPIADPNGSILGASSPVIFTLGVNNKSMQVSSLPGGYVLSLGDWLSFDYASDPVRRAFHRIVEKATANGSGVTPSFEVRPHFRPGATTGLAVTLIKPAPKVFIMPDSFDPGTTDFKRGVTEGMSFQVMQRP
jgi:hypothetical protein